MAKPRYIPVVVELPATLWREEPESPAKAKEQLNALYLKAYGVPFERVVLNSTLDALQAHAVSDSNKKYLTTKWL
jgi:hypothetical protein